MDYFAGLDVSVKATSVCIVDDTGRIVREVKVASEPEALLLVLKNPAYHFKRIGLEAGPLSQWLYSALAEADIEPTWLHVRFGPQADICEMLTSGPGISKKHLRDKSDATHCGHRGSNCLHSFTSPRSTRTRLSGTGFRPGARLPKTRLTYGVQSNKLGCTTT